MPTVIDVPVDMTVSSDGDPVSFVWDRFEHTIIGQPQAIFKRIRWWESTPENINRIDTELWRVDASRGGAERHRYDLRRDIDGSWVLALDWG